jgi:hypothetical protein
VASQLHRREGAVLMLGPMGFAGSLANKNRQENERGYITASWHMGVSENVV